MNMSVPQDTGSFGREWREHVMEQLGKSAEMHQNTAVILERVQGRIENDERRIASIENTPASIRNWLGLVVGMAASGCGCFGLVSTISALVGLAMLLSRLH